MKIIKLFLAIFFGCSLKAQTADLVNFEVTLIGPYNTDRHHPKQIKYYLDYFEYLDGEINLWLSELNAGLKDIRKRNGRRIQKRKPIKAKDYPVWKKNNQIIKSLEEDKKVIAKYVKLWKSFNIKAPDSVAYVFMEIFDENLCYDLISDKIVLAPKEYKITLFEPEKDYFDWKEFIPKTAYRCPEGYESNGKNCAIKLDLEITDIEQPIFLIQNLLTDLPFHLDGFKRITCPNGQ